MVMGSVIKKQKYFSENLAEPVKVWKRFDLFLVFYLLKKNLPYC